jgi:hypothetical protein
MRLLKRTQTENSLERTAFAARLISVTERGRVDTPSASSEDPTRPQAPVRRFWTPQEAAENGRG